MSHIMHYNLTTWECFVCLSTKFNSPYKKWSLHSSGKGGKSVIWPIKELQKFDNIKQPNLFKLTFEVRDFFSSLVFICIVCKSSLSKR